MEIVESLQGHLLSFFIWAYVDTGMRFNLEKNFHGRTGISLSVCVCLCARARVRASYVCVCVCVCVITGYSILSDSLKIVSIPRHLRDSAN